MRNSDSVGTLVVISAAFALSTAAFAAQPETIHLADKFLWLDSGKLCATRVFGKFNSLELMVENLRLDHVVGTVPAPRSPTGTEAVPLERILVSLDVNGNGHVAAWVVAGPCSFISTYVESLSRSNDDRSVFYDFGSKDLAPQFSAD